MNDPIAEELAYACHALRVKLQAEEASSKHWYEETHKLKQVIETQEREISNLKAKVEEYAG